MLRDYTFECIVSMPRQELEEFSLRMIHRLVSEDMLSEIFTFEPEEVESEERLQAAKFDAMLRMTAVALGELPHAFSESAHSDQNIQRTIRLILWHFYAISFNLEEAVTLETHCAKVESLLLSPPTDAFGWSKVLTDLLHFYAESHQKSQSEA